MRKADIAIRYFHYWCGKLGVDKPIEHRKDNRMDCSMMIFSSSERVVFKYHTRRIGQMKRYTLLSTIFHEIGHVLDLSPHNTYKQKVRNEYKAELFSVKCMKKYYPEEYKQLLERYRKRNYMKYLKKDEPLYYEAFSKIKDYKETEK